MTTKQFLDNWAIENGVATRFQDMKPSEMFEAILAFEKHVRQDCKKQFHAALDEVVSFDDDNQKSNFIIDVLNKLK